MQMWFKWLRYDNIHVPFTIILLLMIQLLFTSCRFTDINQPASIAPGDPLEVELTVSIDITPEPNIHKGVLCLLLPDDWSVMSAVYDSPMGSGIMTTASNWADSAESCYPAAQYGTAMKWFGLISDTGFTYNERFSIDIDIQMQTSQREGCLSLGYLVTKASSGLLCSGNPAWAPFSFPNPIAVTTTSIQCDTLVVDRAEDWDDLFNRKSGWTGADGIYTIPLSGRELYGNPAEQTLLLFSDTFIGQVDSNGRRQGGWQIINNTFASLKGNAPLDQQIDFFWDESNGHPDAVFIPATTQTNTGDWYWLMDGISKSDSIYMFGLRMEKGNGGVFNFKIAGVTLISFDYTPGQNITEYDQVDTPFYYRNDSEGWQIVFGQAIMSLHGDSGYPSTDGYIYIYGPRSFGGLKELVAARVLPEHFSRFNEWRFWNGIAWVSDITECSPITDGISQEFSVTPVGDKYYLVFQINSNVAIRIGDSPIGPFGPIIPIYECPEPQTYSDVFVYNAKAHPHLSGPDELLISYNVNTFNFIDHINYADIYRPRFITLGLHQFPQRLNQRENAKPGKFVLLQNYPNPFNPTTTIPFRLDRPALVELKIFNELGQEVRSLIFDKLPADRYQVVWDGRDNSGHAVSSGNYFYRLRVGRHHWGKRMVLIK